MLSTTADSTVSKTFSKSKQDEASTMPGSNDTVPRRTIVIIGGGIIGTSIAYYLTRHPSYSPQTHRILLFEANSLASAASGKAGGFVGAWATPKCLGKLSFDLHAQLAQAYDGEKAWGYRRVNGWDVTWRDTRTVGGDTAGPKGCVEEKEGDFGHQAPDGVDWLRPGVVNGIKTLGTTTNSARVNPFLLTRKLASLAEEKGVEIVYAKVDQILKNGARPAVTHRTSNGIAKITADNIIVAAGPWTTQLLPNLPITPLRSHSIVARSAQPLSANVLFPIHAQEISTRNTDGVYPEMYPRPPDPQRPFPALYTCGPDDTETALGCPSEDIPLSDRAIEELSATINQVCTVFEGGQEVARQACYKPQLRAHREGEEVGPAIGKVLGWEGVWVAAGHDEWGISNGPATGLVVADMVMDGVSRTLEDEAAASLDPANFMVGVL